MVAGRLAVIEAVEEGFGVHGFTRGGLEGVDDEEVVVGTFKGEGGFGKIEIFIGRGRG